MTTTMRSVRPVRVYNSARVLQTPRVERIHSLQPVDLNPRGATIAVDVDGQNPFEGTGEIEIVTQASGGMAQADDSQMSQAVIANGVAPVTYSMLPGLGDELVTRGPTVAGTALPGTGVPLKTSSWASLLEKVAGGYSTAQETKQMQSQAQIAQSQSRAAIAEAQSRGTIAQYGAAMAQRKGISGTFLGIAAVAGGVAIWLKMSGKNKTISRRKSKKRR